MVINAIGMKLLICFIVVHEILVEKHIWNKNN